MGQPMLVCLATSSGSSLLWPGLTAPSGHNTLRSKQQAAKGVAGIAAHTHARVSSGRAGLRPHPIRINKHHHHHHHKRRFGGRKASCSTTTCSYSGLLSGAGSASASDRIIELFNHNSAVLSASCSASLKLFLICGTVAWLMQSKRLPAATPSVLSAVAFKTFIPAFLLSKVAATLASQDARQLVFFPLAATSQIVVGFFFGKLAAKLLFGEATQTRPGYVPDEMQAKIVTAACAFGNSMTLPLVYMTTLLSGAEMDRCVGYVALFLLGWSPWLWSLGYNLLLGGYSTSSNSSTSAPASGGSMGSQISGFVQFLQRVVNPPLVAVIVGFIIGVSPLKALVMNAPPASSDASLLSSLGRFFSKSLFDCLTLLGQAVLPVQTIVLASSLIPKNNKEGEGGRVEVLRLDRRVLWAVLGVRHVLSPLAALAIVTALWRNALIPRDPVCFLLLLAQSAMPSAQNLALIPQLREETKPVAPAVARLLLWDYVLCIPPLTLWLSLFMSMYQGLLH
eukprot:jgi/Chlat1/1601/Chrsp124S01862